MGGRDNRGGDYGGFAWQMIGFDQLGYVRIVLRALDAATHVSGELGGYETR
jgi:hypothetical protein